MSHVTHETDLICECGHKWREELKYDVERRWKSTETNGLLANALTNCSDCGYEGIARGIIPENDSRLKFYLKRKNSLHFPRGGWQPSSNMDVSLFLNPTKKLKIHLYEEPSSQTLNLEKIARYLRKKLVNVTVDLRKPFFNRDTLSNEEFMGKMVKAEIHDFSNPNFEPSSVDPKIPLFPEELAYDGFELLSASRELMGEEELTSEHVHIIFTDSFFGTWDEKDLRYHLRLSSNGFPSLISTTGIVEAPARPSEFYRKKRSKREEPSEDEVDGKFLSHNDARLTEIMKGISMQAIFYNLTGEPFCADPQCRLFNGHWQDEIVKAQTTEPQFCNSHSQLLKNLNEKRKNS